LLESKPTGLQNAGKPLILAALFDSQIAAHLPMISRFNAISVIEATENSPTLASLAARARDANERLAAIRDLIPSELRAGVKAGPAEGDSWCVLVSGNAAAAKLRQLAPVLQARLKTRGWDVATLRIKVQTRH